ncbi:MAG: hypothetical protein ACXV8Y_02425 [Acidimicrobiia bacterium]
MKAQGTARVLVVGALLPVLAACSGGGSRPTAASTPAGSGVAAKPGADLIGSGPNQFHRAVVQVCKVLAAGPPGPPTNVTAEIDRVTAAQGAIQAVPDRTAADDQMLAYLGGQLAWLRVLQQNGLGRAGPPPAAPPAAATCTLAARAARP